MVKLLDNTKISKFNYFYMLCMMVYLGSATVFSRSLGNITTFGNAFAMFITIILINKNKIKFHRTYFICIGIFLLYAAATTISNRIINPIWIMQWIIGLTISYSICRTFKEKLFVVFETLMYHMCIIALFFWFIHITLPQLLESIVDIFNFSASHGENTESNVAGNVIFYTLNRGEINEYTFITRNAGFAWEPGAFASYLCLAIFCNSIRTNLRLKKNKSLIIFLLSLLSTQSTTGYMIFIIMILTWLIINRKFGITFIIIPIVLVMFQLPFVKEKILYQYNDIGTFDISKTTNTGTYTLGRMDSFLLDWQEFLRHPIIGLGGWQGGTWLNQLGYDNIATISGIGEVLSMYGSIMTMLFVCLLIKSAYLISKRISKNGYLLIIAIVGMMISYATWKHPLYLCFWMYGVYIVNKNKEIHQYNKK